MKLKLFIVMLIAISLVTVSILGGCGNKSKGNRRGGSVEQQQNRALQLTLMCDFGNDKEFYEQGYGYVDDLSYSYFISTQSLDAVFLSVSKPIDMGIRSVDTAYVLSGVRNLSLFTALNFWGLPDTGYTLASSNSSVISIGSEKDILGNYYTELNVNAVGTAKITATTGDGNKTWMTIHVVDSSDRIPTFTSDPL